MLIDALEEILLDFHRGFLQRIYDGFSHVLHFLKVIHFLLATHEERDGVIQCGDQGGDLFSGGA